MLTPVPLGLLPPERFADVLPEPEYAAFIGRVEEARTLMHGRVVWNVNSTARGGGVAEMLRSLLAYARGAGVDARWLVLEGDDPFFRVTKRLHNRLHDSPGDGGELDAAAAAAYGSVSGRGGEELLAIVQPRDVIVLHDPQTAGLIPAARRSGAPVVWRCHVGSDRPGALAQSAIEFLSPFVREANATIFSRSAFAWSGLEPGTVWVIPPSIDAFSPKNQELAGPVVESILTAGGLIRNRRPTAPVFTRQDGSPGRVAARATMIQDRALGLSDRIVTQVSRWDRLKDPAGVLGAFADRDGWPPDVHLLLAGPEPVAIADDPEAAEVLAEVSALRAGLPARVRAAVHLALLPMTDAEENAALVNALQRHATVAVQKSLAEGFGLTVAEAMWKARPVVASRIGGIQDQIVDGLTGLLVDPLAPAEFKAAVRSLLSDPGAAERMGLEAQRRVRRLYLGPRHLLQYLDLLGTLS